ncbi:MAG TPA: zinc ribbon domain-containing protein [Gemmatimonadales bacterium]|nr:zinc ribbon domain-containing protein [Gemmatimonadales bacterium]
MSTTPCPHCGAPASGKFCSSCGASLAPSECARCRAALSAGAKFCHRCGLPVGSGGGAGSLGKGPWIFAALMSLVLVGWVIWRVNRGVEVAPPPAGQGAGANAPFAGGGAGGPPDLSQMTGREAFLRLHDRIMSSLEQGDTASAAQFTPMAIQAYGMLTPAERDLDIRYHAATLMLGSGDIAAATALTDSLARENPGHLFVDMLRAGIAEGKNQPAAAKRAYQQFLADWDRQIASGRQEYVDHRPLLDAFKERAESLK